MVKHFKKYIFAVSLLLVGQMEASTQDVQKLKEYLNDKIKGGKQVIQVSDALLTLYAPIIRDLTRENHTTVKSILNKRLLSMLDEQWNKVFSVASGEKKEIQTEDDISSDWNIVDSEKDELFLVHQQAIESVISTYYPKGG